MCFVICQKLRHVQVILKYRTRTDLQSNPPKRPQPSANIVEGIENRWLHHVRILTSYDSSLVTSILHNA